MTATPRKREVFANPFFVVLMLASVVFVLTVLAYLVSASVLDPVSGQALGDSDMTPKPRRTSGSLAVARWMDRNAPWVLAFEFGIMFVTGVLAMITDPWFSGKEKRRRHDGGRTSEDGSDT
jgi:hypothetical protein